MHPGNPVLRKVLRCALLITKRAMRQTKAGSATEPRPSVSPFPQRNPRYQPHNRQRFLQGVGTSPAHLQTSVGEANPIIHISQRRALAF